MTSPFLHTMASLLADLPVLIVYFLCAVMVIFPNSLSLMFRALWSLFAVFTAVIVFTLLKVLRGLLMISTHVACMVPLALHWLEWMSTVSTVGQCILATGRAGGLHSAHLVGTALFIKGVAVSAMSLFLLLSAYRASRLYCTRQRKVRRQAQLPRRVCNAITATA